MNALAFEALARLGQDGDLRFLPLDAQGHAFPGWQAETDFSVAAQESRLKDAAALALRLDDHLVLVVELDHGADTLARLERESGPLPSTWRWELNGREHILLRAEGLQLRRHEFLLDVGVTVLAGSDQLVPLPDPLPGQDVALAPTRWVQTVTRAQEAPPPLGETDTDLSPRWTAEERARYRDECLKVLRTRRLPERGRGREEVLWDQAKAAVERSVDAVAAREALETWAYDICDSTDPPTEPELDAKIGAALREVSPGALLNAPVQPGTPEPSRLICWVEEMQSYVTRSRDRLTWELRNPLDKGAAVGVLVNAGMSAHAASDAVRDWEVQYAKAVDCAPDKDAIFRDEHNNVCLNAYVPPSLAPKAGKHPTLDYLIDFLVAHAPGAHRWFLNWLAAAYQKPGQRLKTAPVFLGNQASGKSPLMLVTTMLLGEQNCYSVGNDDLGGRFNAHFAQKLLLTVEELRTEDSRSLMANLKRITGAPTLSVEAKGATAFQARNRLKLICASNDTKVLDLEDGDSRWVMFRNFETVTADHKRRLSTLFTSRSSGVLSERGLAEVQALAWDLKHCNVDWDQADTPYENEARQAAIEASKESPQQFLDAVDRCSLDHLFVEYVPAYEQTKAIYARGMDLPGKPDHTSHAAVCGIYQAFCEARGLRPCGSNKLTIEIERYRPKWFHDRPNIRRPDGSRERVIAWAGIPRDRAARGVIAPLEELASSGANA